MKLVEKNGKDGAEPVHMQWDAAQAAIASGTFEIAPPDGERDVDQPGAQTPAPGTDPVDGKEKAADGQVLTNIPSATGPGPVADGLPKSLGPSEPPPVKAPAAPAAAGKGDAPKAAPQA